jgi:hypothetical protein
MTSNPNLRGSQIAALAATIDPVSLSASTTVSDWIPLSQFERATFLLNVGAIAAGGTLDGKLRQATDGAGSGAKDITGKAMTQLTDTDDNKQIAFEVRSDELDVAGGFTHVALSLTAAVAASLVSAVGLGFFPRYDPADNDLTSIDEIVD